MSCEAVKTFLEQENQKEKNKEAQYRYEVLSHYNLGAEVVFDGNGNKDDYPLLRQDMYGETTRFKYVCDVSDEDFKKVQSIYEKDITHKSGINGGAENTLNVCAVIILILGIISALVFGIIAVDNSHYRTVFHWDVFGIGLATFFVSLINFAFAKVIVNISQKLNK